MSALVAPHLDPGDIAAVLSDGGRRSKVQDRVAGETWLAIPHGMAEVDQCHACFLISYENAGQSCFAGMMLHVVRRMLVRYRLIRL